jgi:hypothetical protein
VHVHRKDHLVRSWSHPKVRAQPIINTAASNSTARPNSTVWDDRFFLKFCARPRAKAYATTVTLADGGAKPIQDRIDDVFVEAFDNPLFAPFDVAPLSQAGGEPGRATMQTVFGGHQIVAMPGGEQLPRICRRPVMHELTITYNIMELVSEAVNGRKVHRITLEIGKIVRRRVRGDSVLLS